MLDLIRTEAESESAASPKRVTLVRRPIRIVQVITGLGAGGAERMMCNVALGLDRSRFESNVIVLSRDRTLAGMLIAGGIPVTSIDAHPFKSLGLGPLRRVTQFLREEKPDVVQTWMLHADLVGGVAARIAGVPVIWNIRGSLADSGWQPFASSLRQRAIARVCAAMSEAVPRHRLELAREREQESARLSAPACGSSGRWRRNGCLRKSWARVCVARSCADLSPSRLICTGDSRINIATISWRPES